jgi:hypothetical protein
MPREKKKGIGRSLLTAAATGAGVVGGAGLGSIAGVLASKGHMLRGSKALARLHSGIASPGRSRGPLVPRGSLAGSQLDKALTRGAKIVGIKALLGAALGAGAGGVGAYQLSKRKKHAMDPNTKEQLLAVLKGLGMATAGGAGVGALVGAGVGSVGANPDPERGRLIHMLRMALKGGAIGGGATAGSLTGGLGAGMAARGIGAGAGMSRANTDKLVSGAGLGGALAGAGAGGALGAKLGAEKRAVLSYILRGHLKQAMLADLKAAVRGR